MAAPWKRTCFLSIYRGLMYLYTNEHMLMNIRFHHGPLRFSSSALEAEVTSAALTRDGTAVNVCVSCRCLVSETSCCKWFTVACYQSTQWSLPLTWGIVCMLYRRMRRLCLIPAILNHVAHYTLMEGDATGLETRWVEREPFQQVHQDGAVKQEFKWFESRVS